MRALGFLKQPRRYSTGMGSFGRKGISDSVSNAERLPLHGIHDVAADCAHNDWLSDAPEKRSRLLCFCVLMAVLNFSIKCAALTFKLYQLELTNSYIAGGFAVVILERNLCRSFPLESVTQRESR